MRTTRRSLGLVLLALVAAIVSGVRLLPASDTERTIHASGTWTTGSRKAEFWRADLSVDGNQLTGEFAAERDGQSIRGAATGRFERSAVRLALRSNTGEAFATLDGTVSGRTVSGSAAAADGASGQWAGFWQADAPRVSTDWPPGVYPPPDTDPVVVDPEFKWPALRPQQRYPKQSVVSLSDSGGGTASVSISSNSLVNAALDGGYTQNEPEIAVDRLVLPDRIVAAAIDYSIFPGVPWVTHYFSNDGGVTWPDAWRAPITGINRLQYQNSADPSVDYDASARPYVAGIAFDDANTRDAIFVARSLNNGASFQDAKIVATALSADHLNFDRPWLSLDKVSGSPSLGNVYVTWIQSTTPPLPISVRVRMSVSTDQAQTFDGGRFVSDDTPAAGSTSAIGLDGSVYVIWRRNNDLRFDRCTSGGTMCGTDRPVVTVRPLAQPLPGTNYSLDTWPSIAVDNSSGGNGAIYVVWNEYRSDGINPDNADIYFTRSTDQGVNFAPKRAVTVANEDEFFPAISVDQNHFIRIIYYKRTDATTPRFNAWEITSGNGGATFTSPTQLNDGGNINPGVPLFGEYVGADTDYLRRYIWMDSRRGNQDVYTATASGC